VFGGIFTFTVLTVPETIGLIISPPKYNCVLVKDLESPPPVPLKALYTAPLVIKSALFCVTLAVLLTFNNLFVKVKLEPILKSAVLRLLAFMVEVFISVKFPMEGNIPVDDITFPQISILFPAVSVGWTLCAVTLVAVILVADTLIADKSTNDSVKAVN